MTLARQMLGQAAEELVAAALRCRGWGILHRNLRIGRGEIDIVALDGDTLVVVEVKAGRQGAAIGPERPALAVDARKRVQIRRLAGAWLAGRPPIPHFESIRFDVVGVTVVDGEAPRIEHIEGAF